MGPVRHRTAMMNGRWLPTRQRIHYSLLVTHLSGGSWRDELVVDVSGGGGQIQMFGLLELLHGQPEVEILLGELLHQERPEQRHALCNKTSGAI